MPICRCYDTVLYERVGDQSDAINSTQQPINDAQLCCMVISEPLAVHAPYNNESHAVHAAIGDRVAPLAAPPPTTRPQNIPKIAST